MKNIIIAIGFVSLVLVGCNQTTKTETTQVKSVLNADNLPLQTFEINNNADTIIKVNGGTLVTIPKNSFADKNGNPISGNIAFELKEILTPLDMVLGNFTTTSDGRVLQTGGMIYTNAKANNENVFLANNKTLTINVPTKKRIDSMLIFTGEINQETQSINWVKPEDIIERVSTEILPTNTMEYSILSHPIEGRSIIINEDKSPIKPSTIEEAGERLLSIKFETDEMFPELQQYQNVKFKVSEKSHFNIEDANKDWYLVKLEKTGDEGIYKVKFTGVENGKTIKKEYLVSPAFEGNDYKKALAEYEQKFKQYQTKKKEMEEEKIKLLKEFEKREKQFEKQSKILAKKQLKATEKNKKLPNINKGQIDYNLNYIFEIEKLGWANIDLFYSDSRTATIDLNLIIENEEKENDVFTTILFKNQNLYIAGYQKKDGTYGFSHNDAEPTNLPIGEEAIITATTYRNDIPYFAFQKITIAKKQVVKMNLTETTKEKLEAYLKENI